ncbi:MAG: lipase family protein [Verrucomicrobiota bacterium]|jgi:triacylglycerol lipase
MNPPISNQYDPANAAALCAASQAAYSPGPLSPAAQIDNSQTDTRVIAFRDSGDLIVAFRGTQDLRNWLTDLDCRLVQLDSFRVHRGFHAALQSVWRDLRTTLSDLAPRRLWFTGHSLGGALAMLAAHHIETTATDLVAGVYTFGQPRVGDARFRDACDRLLKPRAFRCVHAADIVPRVPWLLASFRHAGHEIFFPRPQITNDNFSMTNSKWRFDPVWFQKLPYDLLGLTAECTRGKLALIADHHIDTYLNLFQPSAVSAAHCNP